jgi:hypothetical protein
MSPRSIWLLSLAALIAGRPLRAQDNVRGGAEPIVRSIDVAALRYDYLVDADLPQDDVANKKFKTLQAAYAAAPAGTEAKPTFIALKPGVHFIPRPGPRTPSIAITKNWITFLGLTNNRRAVVIADNCGLFQGADDDGYMLDVTATGFTLRNLTVINYCNTDYEYPGDPSKNLKKRSDVITQAVAIQTQGDKHYYENVAFLSRLDTTFIRTTRAYFKNVYIEGTDDWMGGGQMGVWEDSTLVYPTGRGVMSAANLIFINCRFEAARGMAFYKVEYNAALRPIALINCVVPENTSWSRGKAPPRPTQYSLTYQVKYPDGKPAKIFDGTVGPKTYDYGRELTEREVAAFNPWNLLRAAPNAAPDDWDPAGVKEKYEAAGQGNLPFRMAFTGGGGAPRGGGVFGALPAPPAIRTGGPNASTTLGATVTPARASDPTITWSTKSELVVLSATTGAKVTVTARNPTDRAEFVPINATASDGICITAWVYAEPKFIDPPAFTTAPTLTAPAKGIVTVNYALDLRGKEDQSLITWSICDDASGAIPRLVAVSRGNQPLRSLTLTPGYVGKFLKVSLQPKHPICEAGPAVTAVSTKPIAVADVPSTTVSPNFRNFVSDTNTSYASGLWTVLGTWTVVADDRLLNGYGIRPNAQPGSLLYQNDADTGDMQIDLLMSPEKTEGTGFSIPGSPADVDSTGRGDRNLHSDVLIKYDPRTKNGYALRFWRTNKAPAHCLFQFYKIENGTGSPLSEKQAMTGVFKPTTHMTIKATGNTLTATASNDHDSETLSLTDTIVPNRFGSAGVIWPRGSTNTYSRIEVSYP